MIARSLLITLCVAFPYAAAAQGVSTAGARGPDWIAVAMFLMIVAVTLGITWRSAGSTGSKAGFYTAGHAITPVQNGLATAGDFLSAAAFLGISALVYANGFDGFIYALGFLTGWPIVLFLMSERMRNLGSYTFADAAAFRLQRTPVRLVAATGSLVVVLFYLIAQLIGAGKVIQLLFGINYIFAVLGVGVLMILYVIVGGMQATTWVQITKAVLLLCGGTLLALAALWHFDFSLGRLLSAASRVHPKGAAILVPGGLFAEPVSAISLGLALVFGTAGLPHILMRFFTVKDAAAARKSVFYATACVAYFCWIIPVLGFAAAAILMTDPSYFNVAASGQFNKIADLVGGPNMASIHLAHAMGGPLLLGFISAVAFATILAVVAGLTLAGASAVGHDIYGQVLAGGKASEARELLVSKISAVAIGVVAVLLAYAFENQNVAFMAGLALSVAASCNFPVLVMAMFWRGTTTRGAVAGGLAGLVASVVLVVLSKTVWVAVFGFPTALFPYDNPALVSMPLAFLFVWLFSVTDRSERAAREREAFAAQFIQSEIGTVLASERPALAAAAS
ncbi:MULTISPECIES: cation/acetate symporter ActP [Bradyrhizobium]|jgi:cation/acetate symporter|uniref:cation/acetate symporter ActP n=1 Tax=Bradyrhizobium TaxID=374 RepID=UPI0004B64190|nr:MULTISPECIES: cation/acetate symporter ActP [Bradyrhizobium]MCS3446097.1 cation/acetate symporter [Bradyrhizobium elkanii]MCS3562771.1 cation/acetate symporter [Bradyrhizobium elkanii]MCW2147393.1 cation/acetate symporter [Bradyrhizobium elkanii]MCW2353525.1 cation/acetate symporter [Bradyrhizobium elkanii]MCW2371119.1 cation/acetate symporter [Bradyrhizobium elkanii]